MSNDWNHSVIRNQIKSQMLVEYEWALAHEHMSMDRLVYLLRMNQMPPMIRTRPEYEACIVALSGGARVKTLAQASERKYIGK